MSKQEIFDKFIEIMGEFAQIRAVAALRDGFIKGSSLRFAL